MPRLRDPKRGWLNFAAIFYALTLDLLGLFLLYNEYTFLTTVAGILLSFHGRIIASYLVHEAAHANIFIEPKWNRWFGTLCLWLAGCPYCDFHHVKWMHMSHHNDRADTVEFDYRDFVQNNGSLVRRFVLGLEFCFVPAVETIMHVHCAFHPFYGLWQNSKKNDSTENDRRVVTSTTREQSSLVGITALCSFYYFLWLKSPQVLLLQLFMGALVLQYLSLNDAFHHTYEASRIADYIPGPGPRTAQYEEDNTYSNLVSTQYPLFNLLSLNFGYHNAHHDKAMVSWYDLPRHHEALYGSPSSALTSTSPYPRLLPFIDLFQAFHQHRLRRVLEEDYGSVAPPGTPGRADNFVGALGVSFLTV